MIVNLMVIAYFYYASEWNIISWVYLFNPSILKLASFELDCFLVSWLALKLIVAFMNVVAYSMF